MNIQLSVAVGAAAKFENGSYSLITGMDSQ